MTPADYARAAIEHVDNALAKEPVTSTAEDLGAALRLLAQAVITLAPARGTVAPPIEVNPGTRTTARLEPLTDEPAIGPQSNVSDVPHEVLLDTQWAATRPRPTRAGPHEEETMTIKKDCNRHIVQSYVSDEVSAFLDREEQLCGLPRSIVIRMMLEDAIADGWSLADHFLRIETTTTTEESDK